MDDLPSPKKVVNPLFNIFKDKKKTTISLILFNFLFRFSYCQKPYKNWGYLHLDTSQNIHFLLLIVKVTIGNIIFGQKPTIFEHHNTK